MNVTVPYLLATPPCRRRSYEQPMTKMPLRVAVRVSSKPFLNAQTGRGWRIGMQPRTGEAYTMCIHMSRGKGIIGFGPKTNIKTTLAVFLRHIRVSCKLFINFQTGSWMQHKARMAHTKHEINFSIFSMPHLLLQFMCATQTEYRKVLLVSVWIFLVL